MSGWYIQNVYALSLTALTYKIAEHEYISRNDNITTKLIAQSRVSTWLQKYIFIFSGMPETHNLF